LAATVEGIGIHSGARCRVTLHRDQGPIRFLRNGHAIPADVTSVVDSRRATTLGSEGERVAMVEHLLAALSVRGLWSEVVVEVSGEELPILDGSARGWYELLDELGAPPEAPPPLRPERPIELRSRAAHVQLEPGTARLCYGIAFDHPAIGEQHWCGGPERYAELIDARTFGMLADVEALRAKGFASGANLENAIVFDEVGPLVPLRAENEPVRHKALDALGDLFLLGRPLEARITIWRGSHALHAALMNELLNPTIQTGSSQ
jgi:UDP-3-O-[3-hydroxymyristoyl] N-acetylglucosamine deacetylase